jgi:hypothetical protein
MLQLSLMLSHSPMLLQLALMSGKRSSPLAAVSSTFAAAAVADAFFEAVLLQLPPMLPCSLVAAAVADAASQPSAAAAVADGRKDQLASESRLLAPSDAASKAFVTAAVANAAWRPSAVAADGDAASQPSASAAAVGDALQACCCICR